MDTPDSAARRTVALLAANVIVGVVAPFIVGAITPISVLEGGLVSLLTVVVLSLGEVLLKLERLIATRAYEVKLWDRQQAIDALLSDLRSGLYEIVSDDLLRDSFYLAQYQRDLDAVNARIKNTVLNKEILIERHHIDSTEILLSIYDSPEHNLFRATHSCSDVTDHFDVTYEYYFHAWLARLEARKVEIRRLFIFDDVQDFQRPLVMKLLAFHNSGVAGLEARAVARAELHRFKSDYSIYEPTDDIGIFSTEYIYLGRTRQDDNISGSFSRDRALINRYTSMFDALWNSRASIPITKHVTASISAEELFDPAYQL